MTARIHARRVPAEETLPWRTRYREESNRQIAHDSLHGREGWTVSYLLESDGAAVGFASVAIAGRGGILFHYNRPYGDIYMEVAEPFRRRGLGAYLV